MRTARANDFEAAWLDVNNQKNVFITPLYNVKGHWVSGHIPDPKYDIRDVWDVVNNMFHSGMVAVPLKGRIVH